MQKSIIFGLCASVTGALLVTGISYLWMNLFILFLLEGCIVGFAVRMTGKRHDVRLAVIGGIFSAISCILALFLICTLKDGDFIGTISDGSWIAMLIAIGIGAYQSQNNEFIDDL